MLALEAAAGRGRVLLAANPNSAIRRVVRVSLDERCRVENYASIGPFSEEESEEYRIVPY